jgi:hypothetical protein
MDEDERRAIRAHILKVGETRAITMDEHQLLRQVANLGDNFWKLDYPPEERPFQEDANEFAARIEAERRAEEEKQALDSPSDMGPVVAEDEPDTPARPVEGDEEIPQGEERRSMTSEARVRANRENARKSTGPKSPEGKARSSRNALKHGLLSEHILHFGEDPEELDAFREEMMEDLAPEGAVERFVADHVVESAWRLRRAGRMEKRYVFMTYYHKYRSKIQLDEADAEARLDFSDDISAMILANEDFYPKLVRYEGHFQRGFYKALQSLLGLKALRK